MPSESALWKRVAKWLKGYDPHRVENRLEEGMPDVNCALGWIELKSFHKWNTKNCVRLDTIPFSKPQRIWLRRRWLIDGGAFLFLRVGADVYLFDGLTAFNLPANLSVDIAVETCIYCSMQSEVNPKELIECLKSKCH